MKIRTLFIIALIFFSISSIITYAVYCSSTMSGVAKSQYERICSDIAVNEAENVSQYVKNLNSVTSIVAHNEALASSDLKNEDGRTAAIDTASAYLNGEAGIRRILILDKNGEILIEAAPSSDVNYKLFEKTELDSMIQGDSYVSVILDSNDKAVDYEIVCPYIADDRIFMVYFNNSEFDSIIKAGLFPGSGRVIMVDGMGHVVDSSYQGVISDLAGSGSNSEWIEIKNVIDDSSKLNSSVYFEARRTPMVSYTVRCTGGVNWYVSSITESDRAYNQSSAASSSVAGLVAGLCVLFIAVYVVAVILVTRPLNKIESTLTKIHRGDHDSRVEITGRNEYGDIATAFNNLLDNVVVSERRYRTIVEMSDDIVFEWNLKTNNITFSNNFNKKFSYRAPSDHFSDCFFLKGKVHPEDNEQYRKDLAKLEKGEEFKDNTYRWKNIYGDYIWMQMKTSTIRDNDGNVAKIIGVLSDVDRAKKGELQLIKRASYDALTGVYNRETIENVINNEIAKVAEGSDNFAILFVDIDDFKIYNDQYSHATGDQVLKFVTSSITEIIDDFGFIGRYGGDEFIVCVRNVSTNAPENIARDILAKLKAGFVCDTDDHLTVSVSIGVYIVSTGEKTVEEIISIADDAMYRIKKNGKSSFGIVNDQ